MCLLAPLQRLKPSWVNPYEKDLAACRITGNQQMMFLHSKARTGFYASNQPPPSLSAFAQQASTRRRRSPAVDR